MSTATRDDCYPGCRSERVRFFCPETGNPAYCDRSKVTSPHVREEWAPEGARIRCQVHDVLLVTA